MQLTNQYHRSYRQVNALETQDGKKRGTFINTGFKIIIYFKL